MGAPNLLHGRVKLLCGDSRIENAGLENAANAANAAFMHGVDIGGGRFFVDDRDAACPLGTELLDAVERCGIVGAVNARRHDHDMIHVQRFLQREQIVGGGDWRRVSAARPERKLLRIGEDMRVRIDGAARHVEIDRRLYRRRRRLRSCVAPPRLAPATAPAMRKASLRVSMISSELACFVEHGLREANRSPCRRLAPSLRGRSYFSTKAFSMTKSPGSP